MTTVIDAQTALRLAERRAKNREQFLEKVRVILRLLATESVQYDTFEHGTFTDQLAYELNTLRIEHGDPLADARRTRRNKKIRVSTRKRIFTRDQHTCRRCGWSPSSDKDERAKQHRSGRFLTIDHIIPLVEGGPNLSSNMQTLCSVCNPIKGKQLPEEATGFAA